MRPDGTPPATYKDQADTILAKRSAADIGPEHIVHATSYLADRADRDENRDGRMAKRHAHTCAMTAVQAGMFEDGGLSESDAVAGA